MVELHAAQPTHADLTFAAHAWVPGDRERLYAAIESRFHAMMRAGLLDEVRKLSGIERTPDGRYKMAAAKIA